MRYDLPFRLVVSIEVDSDEDAAAKVPEIEEMIFEGFNDSVLAHTLTSPGYWGEDDEELDDDARPTAESMAEYRRA